MGKPVYLDFSVLEWSKLLMFQTNYDELKPYFKQENIQLHFMDTDSIVISVNTQDIIKDLKNLEDLFDFNNLNENHEIFSNKNKKIIGKFKIEKPKNFWIDEFVCLRNKMFAFLCVHDRKIKLKSVSKSQLKKTKFEEYKNCLDGKKYQEVCNNYI